MKLPRFKSLTREDFPNQESWIERLIFPINQFFQNINTLSKNNISLKDNINCQIKEVNVVEGNEYTIAVDIKPDMVIVGDISPTDTLTAAPYVIWEYIGNYQIKITSIFGLDTDQEYTIKLIIFPEE